MPRLGLSRREGEAIQISDDIFVEIAEISTNQVRLSIVAPREIRILRCELVPDDELAAAPEKPYCLND